MSRRWGKAGCQGKGQPGQELPECSPLRSLAASFQASDRPREGTVRTAPPRGRALRWGEVPKFRPNDREAPEVLAGERSFLEPRSQLQVFAAGSGLRLPGALTLNSCFQIVHTTLDVSLGSAT